MSDTPIDVQTAEIKPREFAGDFDAEKAKRLILNLDTEIAGLNGTVAAVTAERDEFRTAAEKTGTDRDEALAAAVTRAEDAEKALAIKKHDLSDDIVKEFADYLTGTAEEVDAKAAKLAARLNPKAPETPPGDEPKVEEPKVEEPPAEPVIPQTPPVRPRAALVPGNGGDDGGKPFDAKAIASRIRG